MSCILRDSRDAASVKEGSVCYKGGELVVAVLVSPSWSRRIRTSRMDSPTNPTFVDLSRRIPQHQQLFMLGSLLGPALASLSI